MGDVKEDKVGGGEEEMLRGGEIYLFMLLILDFAGQLELCPNHTPNTSSTCPGLTPAFLTHGGIGKGNNLPGEMEERKKRHAKILLSPLYCVLESQGLSEF